MGTVVSINPANGEIVGEVAQTEVSEIASIVEAARLAQISWSLTPIKDRVAAMKAAADELETRKAELGSIASQEMGMPINAAIFNAERAAAFINWYADNVEDALAPTITYQGDGETHTVHRVARGVHGAIFPWNFPYSNAVWACGQSLLVGNAVVLKMSEEIPLSSQLFAQVLNNHLPVNVFTMIYGAGDVGRALVDQPLDFISFTGSTKSGQSVYKAASKRLIPVVMELGGSAPGIVCADADLDDVIPKIAAARLGNAGQRCDGLKRLIVHESIFDSVIDKLVTEFGQQVVGDPASDATTMGTLAAQRQVESLIPQLVDAKDKGAKFVIGDIPDSKAKGAYVQPTILTNITGDMKVWTEEVFAPVLPVVAFASYEQALELANDTEFGLGSHVYTSDPALAANLAAGINTGMVSINGTIYTKPFNPFGGTKASGFGREHGRYGFDELTLPKIVATNL